MLTALRGRDARPEADCPYACVLLPPCLVCLLPVCLSCLFSCDSVTMYSTHNRYMSPEQFRGEAVPESDLYALGGTILFLLSGGRHPSEFQAARLVHVGVRFLYICRDEGWRMVYCWFLTVALHVFHLRYNSPFFACRRPFSYMR